VIVSFASLQCGLVAGIRYDVESAGAQLAVARAMTIVAPEILRIQEE
jgi:hypothetical protein